MWTDTETLNAYRVMLTFRLADQSYALPIEPVVRIIDMVTIKPIPRVNHSVKGVINVHGQAVPVVDMRRHLELPQAPYGLHTPIIIAQVGGRAVGLVVDQVTGVLQLPAKQVARPNDMLPEGLQDPLFPHVARTGEEMVLALDLDRLFSPEQAQELVAVPLEASEAESPELVPERQGSEG
jgi:purine-binding chemotaxis protein CheW